MLKDIASVILHAFADSSEDAYGAFIYLQVKSNQGEVSSQLFCSKSRVSPLKSLTIPRLELSACLLLALVEKCVKAFKIQINKILLWLESTIALAWMRSPPHLLKTFVSNRVAQIQRLSDGYQWNYVSSENMCPRHHLTRN